MADKKNVIINSVPVSFAEKFDEKAKAVGMSRTEFFCAMVHNFNEKEDVFTLEEAEGILKERKEKAVEMGFDDEKPYTGIPTLKN